jgi:hypothetical protein
MKFLRSKAKKHSATGKRSTHLGKKDEPKRSQKILKIWRRKERKNSAPLEFFFPSPTTSLQFCSKPITAFFHSSAATYIQKIQNPLLILLSSC